MRRLYAAGQNFPIFSAKLEVKEQRFQDIRKITLIRHGKR
jgi:hypothetical protein